MHIKNFLIVVLFNAFVFCSTVQAMKRTLEISPYLLQVVEEAMEYEDIDIWREDVTAVIKKKAKFEAALAQVEVPKRIPPVRINLPKIVTPIPLRVVHDVRPEFEFALAQVPKNRKHNLRDANGKFRKKWEFGVSFEALL